MYLQGTWILWRSFFIPFIFDIVLKNVVFYHSAGYKHDRHHYTHHTIYLLQLLSSRRIPAIVAGWSDKDSLKMPDTFMNLCHAITNSYALLMNIHSIALSHLPVFLRHMINKNSAVTYNSSWSWDCWTSNLYFAKGQVQHIYWHGHLSRILRDYRYHLEMICFCCYVAPNLLKCVLQFVYL